LLYVLELGHVYLSVSISLAWTATSTGTW
jgi:hypothetical protein